MLYRAIGYDNTFALETSNKATTVMYLIIRGQRGKVRRERCVLGMDAFQYGYNG